MSEEAMTVVRSRQRLKNGALGNARRSLGYKLSLKERNRIVGK